VWLVILGGLVFAGDFIAFKACGSTEEAHSAYVNNLMVVRAAHIIMVLEHTQGRKECSVIEVAGKGRINVYGTMRRVLDRIDQDHGIKEGEWK
jgi:hypothetical protein